MHWVSFTFKVCKLQDDSFPWGGGECSQQLQLQRWQESLSHWIFRSCTWGWWMLAHEHYWGSIEENLSFSSIFRSFSWGGGEFLLTRIAVEGLKKALAPASDYFAEVVVNASCSQKLLWKDWRKIQLRLNIILLKWWWNAHKNCIARLKKAQSWTIFFFLWYDPCGQ